MTIPATWSPGVGSPMATWGRTLKPVLWRGNTSSPGDAWNVWVISKTRPAASVVRTVVVMVGRGVEVEGEAGRVVVVLGRVQSRFFFAPPRQDCSVGLGDGEDEELDVVVLGDELVVEDVVEVVPLVALVVGVVGVVDVVSTVVDALVVGEVVPAVPVGSA